MKIAELIEFLMQFDPERDVWINVPGRCVLAVERAEVNPFSDPGEPFVVLQPAEGVAE